MRWHYKQDVFNSLYSKVESAGGQVNGIRGTWQGMSDNLAQFNKNLMAGMDINQAAINTFTGDMTKAHGFTDVKVFPGEQMPNGITFKDAKIEFTKPAAPLQVEVPPTTPPVTNYTVPFPMWVPGNRK